MRLFPTFLRIVQEKDLVGANSLNVRPPIFFYLFFLLLACTPEPLQRAQQSAPAGQKDDEKNKEMVAPQLAVPQSLENAIKIEWTDNSDVDSYAIYFSNYSGVNEASEMIENVTSPYVHSGLDSAKTYYYRVGGVKSGKYGPLSNEVSTTPFAAGQAVGETARPTLVTASRFSDSALTISWLNVEGAQSYNIYYSTTPGVSRSSSFFNTLTNPVVHNNLVPNVIYYYRIAGVKDGIPGELSFEIGGVPSSGGSTSGGGSGGTPTQPDAPTNLQVSNGYDKSLQLDWSPIAGATGYNIYYDTLNAVSSSSNKIMGVNPPYLHTGLFAGVTYFYRVAAIKNGVLGKLSTVQSAVADNAPPAPSEPLAAPVFSGASPTSGVNSLALSWSAITGSNRYYLYFSTQNPVTKGATFVTVTNTNYTFPSLTGGTTYYFAVAAVKKVGSNYEVGNLSSQISGIPMMPKAEAPALSLLPGVYAQNSTVSIGLSSATSLSTIYYRTDGVSPSCTQPNQATAYSIPIVLSATSKLAAITCRSNYESSDISEGLYIVNLPTCGSIGDGCYDDAQALQGKFARLSGTSTVLEYVPANPSCSGASCFHIWKEYGGTRFLNATGLWIPASSEWQRKLYRSGSGFDQVASYPAATTDLAGRVCPKSSFVMPTVQAATHQCLYYDAGKSAQALSKEASLVEGQDYLADWTSAGSGSAMSAAWYEGNLKVCADLGMRLPTIFEAATSSPASDIPSDASVVFDSAKGIPAHPSGLTWSATANTSGGSLFWAWSASGTQAQNHGNLNFVRCVLPSESILFCGQANNSCYKNNWLMAQQKAYLGGGEEIEYAPVGAYGFNLWREKGGNAILKATGIWNGDNDWQKELSPSGLGFSPVNFVDFGTIGGRACPPNVFLNHQNATISSSCLYFDGGSQQQWLTAGKTDGAVAGVDYLEFWNNAVTGSGIAASWYEGNIKTCGDKGMRLPTLYETKASAPSTGWPADFTPIFAGSLGVPSAYTGPTWTASARASDSKIFFNFNSTTTESTTSMPMFEGALPTVGVRCVLPASEPIFNIVTNPISVLYSAATASFSVEVEASVGTSITYKWQRSSDGGLNYQDIPGRTSQTLNLTDLVQANHRDKVRVVVTGSDGVMAPGIKISQPATLFALQELETCGIDRDTGCYQMTAALNEGVAMLQDGTLIELVEANGDFKVWKELNGDRILSAGGLWATDADWQRKLTRNGEAFSANYFTDYKAIAGRACPGNVFVNRAKPAEVDRCLYYDSGSAVTQSLKQSQIGLEREDWLNSWRSPYSGQSTTASWYEGNVKVCADKGMRLPTLFETTVTGAPNFVPIGSSVIFNGNGIPNLNGLTWTASAQLENEFYFIVWSTSSAQIKFSNTTGINVRCALP
jgi:fibronectin type 3 domain-containing protein